jgi:thioredoxin reductase (NADPH)
MRKPLVDVAVIGSGVAGMAAAKSVAELGFSVSIFESGLFGGLVVNISELLDMPTVEATSGYRLASRMKLEGSKLGVATVPYGVSELLHDGNNLILKTQEGDYRARAVILASGARLKRLQIPGESEFLHQGVSLCADCDGPMFKNEEVCVVGGGDSAMQAALTLSKHCAYVHVLQREAALSANQRLADIVRNTQNVNILLGANIKAITGDTHVRAVSFTNSGEDRQHRIPCTGVFAYVGLEPNSDFLPAQIRRDERGYVAIDDALCTTMENVYAVGAIRSGFGGLVSDALVDAQAAARGLPR